MLRTSGLSVTKLPEWEQWSLLAGARFALAMVVAVNHLGTYMSLGALTVIPKFGAFEAILGFLIISGYSIGWSLQKHPDGFLWRRLRRVFPVYWVAVIVALISLIAAGEPLPPALTLAANILMLNQLVTSTSLVGPAWSLSLEFWLYMLAPLLSRLTLRTLIVLLWLSFAAFAIYTPLRSLLDLPYYSAIGFGGNLLFLSFCWTGGFALARAQHLDGLRILRHLGLVLVAHMTLRTAIQFVYRYRHDDMPSFLLTDSPEFLLSSITLVMVWLLFRHIWKTSGSQAGTRSIVLRTLGDISYPLYLLHIPVFELLPERAPPILALTATTAVAFLVYALVDRYSLVRHVRATA